MNRKEMFIIDFNSKQINFCLASGNKNKLYSIKKLVKQDYSGFIDGDFLDKTQVGEVINNGVELLGVADFKKNTSLYIGVPAHFSNTVLKLVKKNYNNKKKIVEGDLYKLFDMAENFKTDNQTVINRSAIYYELDDGTQIKDPIGKVTSTISALVSIIIADNNFINIVKSNLPVLNVNSIEFVSSVLAESLYLLDSRQRDEGAILVDLGYISSSVSYVRGDGLMALRSFSVGGGHIIGDLSQCLKIPFSTAEKLTKQVQLSLEFLKTDTYPIKLKNQDRAVLADLTNQIIISRLSMIAKLIVKCIKSFNLDEDVTTIYLTGECAELVKGMRDYLSKLMKINIELLSPDIIALPEIENSTLVSLIDIASIQQIVKTKTFWQKIFGF